MTTAAAALRAELRAAGLSQTALAARLGVAITTVNRWVNGKVPVPQYARAFLEERRQSRRVAAATGADDLAYLDRLAGDVLDAG